MLNELANKIHKTAVEHGWWNPAPSFGEVVALCHSELSEALEEHRADRPMVWYACKEREADYPCNPKDFSECSMEGQEEICVYRSAKPEGIAIEMSDCLIRILDWAGHEGIDIDAIVKKKMDYNETRSYRHGGKKL